MAPTGHPRGRSSSPISQPAAQSRLCRVFRGRASCSALPNLSIVKLKQTNKKTTQGSEEGATVCSSAQHSDRRLPNATADQLVKANKTQRF